MAEFTADLAGWDAYLAAKHPDTGFMQASWWHHVVQNQNWGVVDATLFDNGERAGGGWAYVRQFEPGLYHYLIPDGPVLSDDQDYASMQLRAMIDIIDAHQKQHGITVSHLRIEPKWTKRPAAMENFIEGGSWTEPRRSLMIDLTKDEDAILAQMKPKGRYNIRLAKRHGVTITQDRSPAGLADFLEIHYGTMARKDVHMVNRSYFVSLHEAFYEADAGTFYFAEYEGMRLAAALVIFHGERATYFFGGARSLKREVMAPYLMHFQIMLDAKAQGYRWYDFYGIAPKGEASHDWAGFSDFKRKFGGVEFDYGAPLDLIADEAIYSRYFPRIP